MLKALHSSRLLLSSVLTLQFLAPGFARAENPSLPKIKQNILLEEILKKTTSADQALWWAAAAGADRESLRALYQDLKSKESKSFPQLSLKENELNLNNQATGIWIDPKPPLRIAYQGVSWNYDAKKSLRENYFSLNKFLSSKKVSLRSRILLPEAQAEISDRDWRAIGTAAASTGILLAAVFGTAVLVPSFVVAMPVLMTLGLIVGLDGGAQLGFYLHDRKVLKEAFAGVSKAEQITVTCSKKSARLRVVPASGESTVLEIERKPQSTQLSLLDEDNEVKTSSIVQMDNPIYKQLMNCKNETQAAAVTASLRSAIQDLKAARQESEGPAAAPAAAAKGAI